MTETNIDLDLTNVLSCSDPASAKGHPMPEFDLVLTGGRVLDPSQGIDDTCDVAFVNGRVALVEDRIAPPRAHSHRDVSGLLVTPGLIDLHTHVYGGGTSVGVEADTYARKSAITTLVDTGSVGPGNFAGFRDHVIAHAATRILTYLHISHAGIYAFSDRIMVGESEDLRLMDPLTAVEVARANPDLIVGIKVRVGRWTSGNLGLAPYHYARDAAEAAGLPMMVHIDEAPPSYDEVAALLRKGDVLTHCFRPFPNTPLAGDGTVRASVQAARDRGVIFDIGHGMGSFSVDVARQMLAHGFAPDTISSDVHALCINGPAFDLVTTLSKFLTLGMPLTDVIRAATSAPARTLSRPDLGTLKPGAVGDASILALEDGQFEHHDTVGEAFMGTTFICAKGRVLAGQWDAA